MSDEHNTPENSSAAKPRTPRRPAAKKSPATSVGTENASHATAENSAAPAENPKPAKPRAPRRKSAAASTAADKGEVKTGDDKAAPPKKPARPARKSATPKATSVTEATGQGETTGVSDASSEAPKPTRSGRSENTRTPRRSATPPKATAARAASESTTEISPITADENAVASAPQEKIATPKPRSRRGAKPRATTPATATAATTSAPADGAANASSADEKPQELIAEARKARNATAPLREALPETDLSARDADAPTVNTSEGESAASEDGEQPAPRKSRRGRRGGRGRNRKARQGTQDGDQNAADTASPALNESAEAQPRAIDYDADDEDDEDVEATDDAASEAPAKARGRRDSTKKATTKAKDKEAEGDSKPGRRKMFISVVPGEQVEVALVEEGVIGEYYLDMLNQAKTKGNIYKGVVHNVDPNLQAAFVNYGANKNGFLQIDEIHTEYYLSHHEAAKGKKYPPIQKVIKPGQEVLVQVVKEPTGNKGAFLTTWLSLAGRFLVLTPGQEQIGVSRKVDNDEERARLREMMNGIEPGEGLGVIVRTVSAGTSKTTLKNDLQYLKRVWKEIRRRGTAESAPSLVYQESSLAERAVRDYLTEDVCEVWVDNASVAESLRETVALLFPRKEDLVRVHADVRQTLWERFNIQRQLEQIYSREVTLPSGGRLVFDQTEALMAVDINSGKISGKANFESMALKTNIEAAEAIARHLKLRDIGGQVVIDFIEMRDKNHVREVEKTLRNAMKNDRARHDVARMSSFGLLEIVRQRTGSSALAVTMEPCPCCHGTGIRRNMEWQSLQALRQIGRQARTPGTTRCVFEANAELGMYLLNHKRDRLREMEQQLNIPIEIRIQP